MKKRAKLCFYIFVICAFVALGIVGYFIINPQQDNVMVGSKKFVTFTKIDNAASYSIEVKDPAATTQTQDYVASYTISKTYAPDTDQYIFDIDVEVDGKMIAKEHYIQKITFSSGDLIDCEIKDYKVTFYDTDGGVLKTAEFVNQNLKEINKDSLFCVVSEYFENLFVKDGTYKIICVGLDATGNEIGEAQEFEYEYEAYYKNDFLRRANYYINGEWCDYVVSSEDDLDKLVWHSILYRQNDVTFFVDTDLINQSNINNLVIDAINNYPEYDGLKDNNTYATMQENIGKLINFDFYLDSDFTKTYLDLQDYDKRAYDRAIESLHKKDTTFNVEYVSNALSYGRNFKIDDVQDEVAVFNTEQLFMVVQYGAKPVFTEEESVVKTVYQNAKNELARINNSDALTDYEKALNIYRYLCQEVVYDYVTYDFMAYKNDFTINNFGNYNCFYLEGVLLDLDHQYAVCDGLAKAYTLMCNIEGIDCVKVNGEVLNSGAHAWNKVCLPLNNGQNAWYYVDTTWGVATYSNRLEDGSLENYEILTHSYFLEGNDAEKIVKFEAWAEDTDAENFDYYDYSTYEFTDTSFVSHTGDFLIESNEELQDIFDYAKFAIAKQKAVDPSKEASVVLEIKASSEYLGETNSLLKRFYELNASTSPMASMQISNWFISLGIDNSIDCEWFEISKDTILFRFYK